MSDERCMVNIYLKEDKYFRENRDRRRKFFIFANCLTQNKGKQEKPSPFIAIRRKRRHLLCCVAGYVGTSMMIQEMRPKGSYLMPMVIFVALTLRKPASTRWNAWPRVPF